MNALIYLNNALSPVRRLALLPACIVLCFATPFAQAAYRVELDAPSALKGLLTEHLDLFRYRERDDIQDDQLNFMIETAPDQVERLASTEGYFSPKTTVKVDRTAGTTVVRLTVSAGERTSVSSVKVDVRGAAVQRSPAQTKRVERNWRLKAGEPFRQEEWEGAKQAGLNILQRRRYAAARIVESSARVDADAHRADLAVSYDSGPVFTLGELKISGTHRYPDEIIRNINPLKTGEEYSAERLLEFQRQILRTPYFSNAVIDIDKDPAKADSTPVDVQVTEFPKQRIRAGVGYTTDTGTQLEGRYGHHDVFRRAWVLETELSLEQERQFGSLGLARPPDGAAFVNSAHGSIERRTLEGIELRSRRVGARRTRLTDARDIAYSLEYYRDSLEPLSAGAKSSDSVVEPGTHQALVAGIEQTRRQVDNLNFPRDGRIVTLQAGAAVQGVLTDQTFFRLYGQVREYVPVGRRDLVILRAEAGYILSEGGNAAIPASLLFRAGGTDSVRGYAYQSIGNERGDVVYPTRFMATGSAEYQHWFDRPVFKQRIGAAVFYDVGTATDSWSEKTLHHAVGVGLRWRSPVGRVNADIAYGLKDGTIRPHLSLGVAF